MAIQNKLKVKLNVQFNKNVMFCIGPLGDWDLMLRSLLFKNTPVFHTLYTVSFQCLQYVNVDTNLSA